MVGMGNQSVRLSVLYLVLYHFWDVHQYIPRMIKGCFFSARWFSDTNLYQSALPIILVHTFTLTQATMPPPRAPP